MCKTDQDCGAGLFCGSNDTCTADCTPTGNQCGVNEACSSTGRCVSAPPDLGQAPGCPAGLTCNASCPNGLTTTITGKVYDPAGKNGLYNVSVYVPQNPLTALPKGVPTGADACSCAALFPSGAYTSTSTTEDGSFTLPNVPAGPDVPLVIQIGKWRRLFKINVTACAPNAQPDKSLALPSTVAAGDINDNIPDIAVSTGNADSLECLMRRIGLPASEYVAGTSTAGHVHVFSGGGTNLNNSVGIVENAVMPGAPTSSTDLWSTQAQLMPYDVVLLSCEGGETYNANPPALEGYLNAGGRVFASHYHYSWFSGPLDTTQAYTAPQDWGTNLATWTEDPAVDLVGTIGGIIDTVLNGSTAPFPKGVSLQRFLTDTNALYGTGVAAGELSIDSPRYNAVVSAANKASQAWITSDATGMAGQTMYFSFDTPVNAMASADGGAPAYCGRAVFSDLHVSAGQDVGHLPPPASCADTDLSPQEKALEFMIFDLSSCVIPDTVAPPAGVPIQ
jgi:hypothetical protein